MYTSISVTASCLLFQSLSFSRSKSPPGRAVALGIFCTHLGLFFMDLMGTSTDGESSRDEKIGVKTVPWTSLKLSLGVLLACKCMESLVVCLLLGLLGL